MDKWFFFYSPHQNPRWQRNTMIFSLLLKVSTLSSMLEANKALLCASVKGYCLCVRMLTGNLNSIMSISSFEWINFWRVFIRKKWLQIKYIQLTKVNLKMNIHTQLLNNIHLLLSIPCHCHISRALGQIGAISALILIFVFLYSHSVLCHTHEQPSQAQLQ